MHDPHQILQSSSNSCASMSTSALSSDAIRKLGLELVGFDEKRQTCSQDLSIRRFRAHYGVDSPALSALIFDMEREGTPVIMKSLFMAINWLKLYEQEEVMAGRWGYGEKYCRETVQNYLKRIQKLKSIKISFDDLNPDCQFLAVDTVHVRSEEFRCDPNSKWWSHKFNGPGVSFEVVCDPVDGKIR